MSFIPNPPPPPPPPSEDVVLLVASEVTSWRVGTGEIDGLGLVAGTLSSDDPRWQDGGGRATNGAVNGASTFQEVDLVGIPPIKVRQSLRRSSQAGNKTAAASGSCGVSDNVPTLLCGRPQTGGDAEGSGRGGSAGGGEDDGEEPMSPANPNVHPPLNTGVVWGPLVRAVGVWFTPAPGSPSDGPAPGCQSWEMNPGRVRG